MVGSVGLVIASSSLLPRMVLASPLLVVVPIDLVLFKVRVVASLLGRETPRRVIYQHHFQHVKPGVVQVCADWLSIIAAPLGE